jgi:hypothetical protein
MPDILIGLFFDVSYNLVVLRTMPRPLEKFIYLCGDEKIFLHKSDFHTTFHG